MEDSMRLATPSSYSTLRGERCKGRAAVRMQQRGGPRAALLVGSVAHIVRLSPEESMLVIQKFTINAAAAPQSHQRRSPATAAAPSSLEGRPVHHQAGPKLRLELRLQPCIALTIYSG